MCYKCYGEPRPAAHGAVWCEAYLAQIRERAAASARHSVMTEWRARRLVAATNGRLHRTTRRLEQTKYTLQALLAPTTQEYAVSPENDLFYNGENH